EEGRLVRVERVSRGEGDRGQGEGAPEDLPRHASYPSEAVPVSFALAENTKKVNLAGPIHGSHNGPDAGTTTPRNGDRAPAPPAGRDRMQALRRPLRQGRLPGRLPLALVPVRLRLRGPRPHVHRLHAEGVRRRDRPADAGGGRGAATRLRR